MRRRRFLAAAGSGLVALAGCLGVDGAPSAPTAPGSATTAPDSTTTEAATSSGERARCPTPTPTTPETTTEHLTGVAPDNRLVVHAAADLTVTVTMYEGEQRACLLARERYALAADESVRVDEFVPSGYVVIAVGDEDAWEGVVGSADHYDIRVTPDGEATVVQHVAQ